MEKNYDPSFILSLFRKELNPDSEEARKILKSLEGCTHAVSFCRCGCGDPYFIDPKSPEWKFRRNITIYHDNTLYILDIMEDWTVGSIEVQRDFPMPLGKMKPILVD